jgi:hypothetical protein
MRRMAFRAGGLAALLVAAAWMVARAGQWSWSWVGFADASRAASVVVAVALSLVSHYLVVVTSSGPWARGSSAERRAKVGVLAGLCFAGTLALGVVILGSALESQAMGHRDVPNFVALLAPPIAAALTGVGVGAVTGHLTGAVRAAPCAPLVMYALVVSAPALASNRAIDLLFVATPVSAFSGAQALVSAIVWLLLGTALLAVAVVGAGVARSAAAACGAVVAAVVVAMMLPVVTPASGPVACREQAVTVCLQPERLALEPEVTRRMASYVRAIETSNNVALVRYWSETTRTPDGGRAGWLPVGTKSSWTSAATAQAAVASLVLACLESAKLHGDRSMAWLAKISGPAAANSPYSAAFDQTIRRPWPRPVVATWQCDTPDRLPR